MKALQELVDRSVKEKGDNQPKRDYCGASILGTLCDRQLFFKYNNVAPDRGKDFSGQLYRVFDRGTTLENNIIQYLTDAGFVFRQPSEGDQFGFVDGDISTEGALTNPKGVIRGHCDGIIDSSPLPEIPTPCLFEAKCLNDKSWNWLSSKGLKKGKGEYFIQVQVYMHYFKLDSCLFVALNANDMTLYYEVVKYDERVAVDAIERGKRVVEATFFEELPKAKDAPNCFPCDWCSYRETCNP